MTIQMMNLAAKVLDGARALTGNLWPRRWGKVPAGKRQDPQTQAVWPAPGGPETPWQPWSQRIDFNHLSREDSEEIVMALQARTRLDAMIAERPEQAHLLAAISDRLTEMGRDVLAGVAERQQHQRPPAVDTLTSRGVNEGDVHV